MQLTPEQRKELARFPAELRSLIEAELAAGNAIDEVGHSHPAPPAGAYFKLVNKVTTREHSASKGITFRERNSSLSSGEFGDPTGFFFVVEPPNPPPPEVDMDAIRRAHEPKPDALSRIANREAGDLLRELSIDMPTAKRQSAKHSVNAEDAPSPISGITVKHRKAGVKHELQCCDKRPPEQMQEAMERELMVLFERSMENDMLTYRANGNVNGARHEFEFQFFAVSHGKYFYRFISDASWQHQAATHHDYFQKVSDSWFQSWTRNLQPISKVPAHNEPTAAYQDACDQAQKFEFNLDTVEAIQQEVIARLKRGARFATSHKEGGTNITHRLGKFVRDDYGDYPDNVTYKDEADFLAKLRMFMHWEVARNFEAQKITEFEAWKLILRRMWT